MTEVNMDIFKCSDVVELCQPLKEYFDISTFSYLNIYPDLSRIHLDYHYEWTKEFYTKIEKYTADKNLTELTHWESGFSTLYPLEDPCISDATSHGIGDGIVIANELDGCTELCYIGSQLTNTDVGTAKMLNNIDLLQQFLKHFRHKADKLIKEAQQNPIILPNTNTDSAKRTFSFNDETKRQFINNLNKDQPPITQKEYQCLKLLSQGLTSKEIAIKMNISPKTVSRHFENIKKKHNLTKKSSLLELI